PLGQDHLGGCRKSSRESKLLSHQSWSVLVAPSITRPSFAFLLPLLFVFLGGCGDTAPLPGEELLAEMEPGYAKQAILNSLPEGPGVDTGGAERHGYRLDRYFLEGRSVEILWLRGDSQEPLEELTRAQANPVIFVDEVLDGWGWAHFDQRQEGWSMIDRTDPPPPPEAPELEHDDSPDPPSGTDG
ncbi:MAG: hypothetical protein EA351_00100, partial [Gemmatimonadales bacterium]